MKNILCSIYFLCLTSTCFAQKENGYVPDQIVIQFKNGVPYESKIQEGHLLISNAYLNPLLKTSSFTYAERIGKADCKGDTYLLHFNAGLDVEKAVEEFKQTGLFKIVEPNWFYQGAMIPNDPVFPRQYGLNNTGNFNLTYSIDNADADLPEAWDMEQGDSNVVVAVLDAGIAFAHPDLAGRIWINHGEVANNSSDDDLNGYQDDWRGWNFAYGNNNPADDLGHGTATAGIIGANGNDGLYTSGVDWNCKLMICKVLDSTNFATLVNITEAIYYATDNGANVINMSFAGPDAAIVDDAIQYAWDHNVVLVAATGNANTDVPQYPAADSLVIAVGGSNAWDVRYIWSNYGSYIDVVGAADYIYILDYNNFGDDSLYASGTSLSAPLVSGIAALLKAQKPSRTNEEIDNIIRWTAEDTVDHYDNEDTPGWDQYFGYGRVNAYRALMYDTTTVNTSVGEINDHSLLAYPNPTNGIVHLNNPEKGLLEVYNYLGVLIKTETVGINSKIDLEGNPAGVYYLSLKTQDAFRNYIVTLMGSH